MKQQPRHLKQRKRSSKRTSIEPAVGFDETQQFTVDSHDRVIRRHSAFTYFAVTFMICIIVATLATAFMAVDFRGRKISFGENDTTVAFSNDSEGLAQVNLLGREMSFDYEFAIPFLQSAGRMFSYAADRIPSAFLANIKLVPQLYLYLCGYVSEFAAWLGEGFS